MKPRLFLTGPSGYGKSDMIRRELGGKWAVYVVLWQCAVAWLAALLVQIIGGFL